MNAEKRQSFFKNYTLRSFPQTLKAPKTLKTPSQTQLETKINTEIECHRLAPQLFPLGIIVSKNLVDGAIGLAHEVRPLMPLLLCRRRDAPPGAPSVNFDFNFNAVAHPTPPKRRKSGDKDSRLE